MSTPALSDKTPRRPAPGSDLARGVPAEFVETYYVDGAWHSRRHDSRVPFASGDDELDQIALGSQVARWNRLPHIIRTASGDIAEVLYVS
ncbi:hypothetical protein E0H75_40820 [Kribbella capetownensis]|uniref:DUF2188 domain-containing protein n=1 Tax=Kribbella capetownensis TaxID=1572659 RepID=A0A4R0IU88_9ACTN|nr:hypothetical protein [Kribbella capetownensis]TCC37483.1 hypothetical protein E0H75_40820 [Kribbella capetownensis]